MTADQTTQKQLEKKFKKGMRWSIKASAHCF